MKKIFLVLFVALSVGTGLSAQQFNEQVGFVVTMTGDTLNGFIKDRSNIEKVVHFRHENKASLNAIYTPEQIKLFSYSGGYLYYAVLVPTTDSTSELQFLQCIVDGYMRLFYRNKVFYLSENNAPLIKLEKQNVIDQSKLVEDKRYVRMLEYIMADCPEVARKAPRTDFNTNSMSKIVEQYNTCKTGVFAPPVVQRRQWFPPQIGVKLGAALGNYESISKASGLSKYTFNPDLKYSGGLTFQFRINHKFSFQPEILLTAKRAVGQRVLNGLDYKHTIDLLLLQTPLMIYYHVPTQKIQPYVGGGVTYGYVLKKNQPKRTTWEYIENDELGFRLSAGLYLPFLQKVNVRVEYTFEQTLQNRLLFKEKLRSNTHYLCLKYQF